MSVTWKLAAPLWRAHIAEVLAALDQEDEIRIAKIMQEFGCKRERAERIRFYERCLKR